VKKSRGELHVVNTERQLREGEGRKLTTRGGKREHNYIRSVLTPKGRAYQSKESRRKSGKSLRQCEWLQFGGKKSCRKKKNKSALKKGKNTPRTICGKKLEKLGEIPEMQGKNQVPKPTQGRGEQKLWVLAGEKHFLSWEVLHRWKSQRRTLGEKKKKKNAKEKRAVDPTVLKRKLVGITVVKS